ncbi:MAG: SDR family oxidoreductase [Pseudomonadota bacterium]|nr:SDR family oxidoreductase [Pseudomonadota bacterium]
MLLAELFSLRGRIALVTGASSGIGRAMAEALAEAGAKVALVARRKQPLDSVADAMAASGRSSQVFVCDLADRAELAKLGPRVVDALGAPDILINAAGINPRQPADTLATHDWDRTLEINLSVPFFLAQQLAPAMIARNWGRILNIASLQSVRAFADGVPYGASKGGILQLTRALAQAWSRHGVNCNAIAPGFFPTELTAAVFNDPQRARQMAERTLIGRNGMLDDLRGATVFLASRASDYITGQTLFVDGGFTAG